MEFEKGKCSQCRFIDIAIESTSKICLHCASKIVTGIRHYEKQLKGESYLKSGRGKWYFSFDTTDYSTPSVGFTPIEY